MASTQSQTPIQIPARWATFASLTAGTTCGAWLTRRVPRARHGRWERKRRARRTGAGRGRRPQCRVRVDLAGERARLTAVAVRGIPRRHGGHRARLSSGARTDSATNDERDPAVNATTGGRSMDAGAPAVSDAGGAEWVRRSQVPSGDFRRSTGFLGGQICSSRVGNGQERRIRAFRPGPAPRLVGGCPAPSISRTTLTAITSAIKRFAKGLLRAKE